ncbi:apolipoprotein N-acyltransferase [Iocasia frigidifontis]|uniref:Apolipoprotein N-acyltransferase n=1 Tax=Iocasia fonsfrigidae TaxID=2682810 RepID=A0A8A7K8K7_9FIRM|nr:apolipoprotein N-acyltransferase [Iocasia fonsfrigidae]QTL98133.1 apolipoprotein N-acyltransferase [Iocasia fonsfrigidae]
MIILEVVLIILAGILITIPVRFSALFFLAWFGLIPFIYAISGDKPSQGFKKGVFLGIIIVLMTSYWLYYPLRYYSGLSLMFCLIILLSFYLLLAVFYGLWAWFYLYIKRNRSINPLWLALTWTAFEYIRFRVFRPFPFAFIAYTQASFKQLLQFADLGGVFLISFIVILINAFFYKFFIERKKGNALFIIIIFIIIFSYGGIKLSNYKNQDYNYINLGIVQTNLDPVEKWKTANIESNINYLVEESRKINDINLIIWPESSLTFDFIRNEYYRERFVGSLKGISFPLLTGSLSIIDDDFKKYNSVFLLAADGKIMGRYNKIKLLPFGEYIPFKKLVEKITGYTNSPNYPGGDINILNLPSFSWRTVICSEILYPDFVMKGIKEADLIINQSNEAWFQSSNLSRQMWTTAVFRAVENRRAVVRSGNKSFGGVISPAGINIKKVYSGDMSTVKAAVPLNRETTFYQLYGDFIGYISTLILLILFLLKIVLKYLKNKQ